MKYILPWAHDGKKPNRFDYRIPHFRSFPIPQRSSIKCWRTTITMATDIWVIWSTWNRGEMKMVTKPKFPPLQRRPEANSVSLFPRHAAPSLETASDRDFIAGPFALSLTRFARSFACACTAHSPICSALRACCARSFARSLTCLLPGLLESLLIDVLN